MIRGGDALIANEVTSCTVKALTYVTFVLHVHAHITNQATFNFTNLIIFRRVAMSSGAALDTNALTRLRRVLSSITIFAHGILINGLCIAVHSSFTSNAGT